jgi:hypothetical protein
MDARIKSGHDESMEDALRRLHTAFSTAFLNVKLRIGAKFHKSCICSWRAFACGIGRSAEAHASVMPANAGIQ